MKFYPSHTNILNRFSSICSQHTGILESQIIMQASSSLAPEACLCTAAMPDYHKALLGENVEISYHLSGYGLYREEAVIRVMGEGVERYGLLTSTIYHQDEIKYSSYNQLKREEPNCVIPWEYIEVYSTEDYEKLKGITTLEYASKDDIVGWIKCPALLEKGVYYYIPAQSMFIGYKPSSEKKEKWFLPGFSKGTAAHSNIIKALKAAIIEAVECDALMIKWYSDTKAKEIIIDDYDLNNVIGILLKDMDYDLKIYDYTVNENLGYVFGVALVHKEKKEPNIVMGCSAGLDPIKAVYRGIMEALAIIFLANNGPIVMPKYYLETVHEKNYTNLDSNVYYWASLKDCEEKRMYLDSIGIGKKPISSYKNLETGSDEEDLKLLINEIKNISKHAVYLDMTPIEVNNKGLKVLRVFIPELVQMSFPGYPYTKHPRLLENGGIIQNEFPHPLP